MNAPQKRQPVPFGKYLLLDRVNIGGMAEVWRAKTFGAGGFERLVAIKRILPNIAEDEEFISMFIDEAKITVQLNHANIAQVFELNHLSNSYFIAMEYVSGKDMRAVFDRCRKRGEPAPIPLTCYVIARCCEGLDYAHRKKDGMGRDMQIVHRDVSPQNALLSYDGEVKVIDFGIAKAAGKATKTQAGILKGKFGYMSPEQIRGLPLDRRSDVFAIGVCLYEMLTGERLFVGDSDFSVLEKVRKVEVLPPSHFNRKIPDALEKIVMKALAKDVDDRYSYGTDVANDLQKFLITSDLVFGQRDLAAFMKATFAEDFEKEKGRLQEYMAVKPPEGMLAAAEMGFGVGSVPAGTGPALNASSVTAIPTNIAPNAPPVLAATPRGAQGLPPISRHVPPTLSPGPGPAFSPPMPQRTPSLVSMPRLTAVAPMLTNGKEEHESTIMADGAGAFDDATRAEGGNLNLRNRGPDVSTDPARPAMGGGAVPQYQDDLNSSTNTDLSSPGSAPPPVLSPGIPRRATGGRMPLPPPTTDTSPTLMPYVPNEHADTGTHSAASRGKSGGNKLVLAIIGAAVILALGIIGAVVANRAPPTGLLMLDLPSELGTKVRVTVNGEILSDEKGKPIATWPWVAKVPVGPATVLIVADGYENLMESVVVNQGNQLTELTKKLKKKSSKNP